MGRTFVRQDAQVQPSDVYTDNLAAGSTLETNAGNVQDDLNGLRSQINRILKEDASLNWYDAPTRGIETLDDDLGTVEAKPFLFRTQVLTDISVTAAQNWEILSVAGSEAPTVTAAVGAVATEGAVVAQATTFGAHNLDLVSGPNAINPKNLCLVRDASTGDQILSGGKEVFALLHSESATDGHTFDDSSNRVQLSFVRENAGGTALEAVPVADIQGKDINYSYVRRLEFNNLTEDAFLRKLFLDEIDAAIPADITLDSAIDNQSGPATQTQNIRWQIADTYTLDFEDAAGTRDLLSIKPNAAGDEIEVNVDDLDINNVNTADFAQGIAVDSGDQAINVGVTQGQIDSAGALKVTSTGANDTTIASGQELFFDDANQTGSTWAQTGGIKLSETTAEWDTAESNFGEVSLLNMINQAYAAGGLTRTKTVAVVTSNTAADTDVGGSGGGTNLDAQLGDYSSVTFLTDVDVFLNGVLLRNGADAAANNDVYPGTSPALGQLKFEFAVKASPGSPDVITMLVWS